MNKILFRSPRIMFDGHKRENPQMNPFRLFGEPLIQMTFFDDDDEININNQDLIIWVDS